MRNIFILSFLLLSVCFCSCSENEPMENNLEILSITKFVVKIGTSDIEGNIDQENKTIMVMVPNGTDLKKVHIDATYNEGAVLEPASGYAYNFVNPVNFTLSKEGASVTYKVTVTVEPAILSFDVNQYYRSAIIENDIIKIQFAYGTDLSKITPTIRVASGCSIEPASNTKVDLSNEFSYVVTNSAGNVKQYKVQTTILPQEKEVRGVWIPDPSHTTVLHSYKNLQEFVNLLDELNINTIYLATWVREMTLFKSSVLKNNTNYASVEEGWLLNGLNYDGPTNDPIKDLLTLAHAKDMKVFFWFEYGFMRSGGENPSIDHPILSIHPEWDGINSFGKAANYNGTDYYLNSYAPDVQEFILSLIEEAIDLYPEVDGIQGDDRLPAAPRNSGYNEITKQLYKEQTGKTVPINYEDSEWVKWRLENLNEFGKKMYKRIKNKKSTIYVASSPNPYPWCVENLMQDWPAWLKGNSVDLLSVQCYRETVSSYMSTLNEAIKYLKENTDKNILNPGIYLRNTTEWEDIFVEQMKINRENNTNGEAFFYNEGLKREVNKRVIKGFYTGKAIFPL